ncbi:MAG: hypothetical protein AAB758_00695 [Patescibacteria group bacterium]
MKVALEYTRVRDAEEMARRLIQQTGIELEVLLRGKITFISCVATYSSWTQAKPYIEKVQNGLEQLGGITAPIRLMRNEKEGFKSEGEILSLVEQEILALLPTLDETIASQS